MRLCHGLLPLTAAGGRDRCDRIAEDLERMRREPDVPMVLIATVTAAPAPWKPPGGRRRVRPLCLLTMTP
ncbi:MAG: hypothetical protein ACLTNK_00300 [Akkermansia muciniphila]